MSSSQESSQISSSENDKHDIFTRWAKEQGIQINGIKASKIPDKGVGIVAVKDLEARHPAQFYDQPTDTAR